jgi:septum formation protein
MSEHSILLLASASPRRRELLALGKWMFNIAPANVNEDVLPGEDPAAYVVRLAKDKAQALLQYGRPEHIIIGADTTVVDAGQILGKPANLDEARAMLRQLRGHTHQVFTGIAALRVSDQKLLTDLCVTDVPMRDYTDEEIEAYIATGDAQDKAGAYAIQHEQFQPVASMSGCYAGVMGLPLCHLTRLLRQLGAPPSADIAARCQSMLKYQCPVFAGILNAPFSPSGDS